MANTPVFNVIIQGSNVELVRLSPGEASYKGALEGAILRERDVLELIDGLTGDCDGTYSFHSVDNAKTFALMYLKGIGDEIEDALDRIQLFEDAG